MAESEISPHRLWIVTDGKVGDEAPLLGLAEHLGIVPLVKRAAPRRPFSWIMPFGPVDPRERAFAVGGVLAPPFPDLCLAAGRRAVPYLRALKRRAPACFTVFYREPGTSVHGADLLLIEAHDKRRGDDVLLLQTGPHRISEARLAAIRAAPPAFLERLPSPRLAVLVGGNSRHHSFSTQDQERFILGLQSYLDGGASLMITPSRRTPPALLARLERLAQAARVHLWNGAGENPYAFYLALADQLVVTADSINMLYEAVATGRPLHVFHPQGGHKKTAAVLARLARMATLLDFPGPLSAPCYPPIDATPDIAAHILLCWRQGRSGVLSG